MSTKESVLKTLYASPDTFLSGEELSNALDVSRTSVWKAIKTLREEGHNIEAVTNKGYRLMPNTRFIAESGLREFLLPEFRDVPIHIFDSIDSTNAYAKKLAVEGASDGTVVIARQQTAGRGRLGRDFFSPKEGIYISIIVKPEFDISKSVLITCAAAVAVARSIEEVSGHTASIKWVNDVYIKSKKVCGILTEGITDFESGRIENLVIGIGLNTSVADFPPELLEVAGAIEGDYSATELAAAVINHTLSYAYNIEAREFMELYRSSSLLIDRDVIVYKGRYKINPQDEIPGMHAHVLDISADGELVVEYEDGTTENLSSGEVTLRLSF